MKENEFKLFKTKCTREGFEKYYDFYLVWFHNAKMYDMRVRPQFSRDYEKLYATAIEVESPDMFAKYW